MLKVGYIGLGLMGKSIARNILKAGFEIVVHNRSRAAVQELAAEGAKEAFSPAEVAKQADIVFNQGDSRTTQAQVGAHSAGVAQQQVRLEVGEALFVRSSRELRLTAAGERFAFGHQGHLEGRTVGQLPLAVAAFDPEHLFELVSDREAAVVGALRHHALGPEVHGEVSPVVVATLQLLPAFSRVFRPLGQAEELVQRRGVDDDKVEHHDPEQRRNDQ